MSINLTSDVSKLWLRRFSKLTCLSTLCLIFAGGMVTSTGSGLAVPDWPLSYGMLFPPMVGGVFYEHGHRMIASTVGLLMLIMTVWIHFADERTWIKKLAYFGLAAVIIQGLLGGLTVILFLPTPVSVAHGVLAQTFFILTIVIAYSYSKERSLKKFQKKDYNSTFIKYLISFIVLIYLQLIFGAIMRHTGSGLAIPDFPKMGGEWFPTFNNAMLNTINTWRFDNDFDLVTMEQIVYHFIHRFMALIILLAVCILNFIGSQCYESNKLVKRTIMYLNVAILIQILLGIITVLTLKSPVITSIHVVNGAVILGLTVLLLLRSTPLNIKDLKVQIIP